ncbi:MAG: YdcF family protein [Rhodocyclaceae bacterium]|nr:YdcF family protein [Rhodocyclaceae bacterium]
MFYLKKILTALALPPIGLILLALLGLWLARRHPRFGRRTAVLSLLALLTLSLPWIADALSHSLESRPPISDRQLARTQAIVILGGGTYPAAPEYGTDTVGRWTLERVRYGVYLQKQSGLPILVSGGAPFGGGTEGDAMKATAERDFHGGVQWVENVSRDTAENAAYSARMLKAAGITRIALVSHGWHLNRAVALFAREGLEVIPAPTGFATGSSSLLEQILPTTKALDQSNRALREWLGILVLRIQSAG